MVQSQVVNGLGTVLVDGYGLTLYLFVPDHGSGRSTCFGYCATAVAARHVARPASPRRSSVVWWTGP